jgi:DNA-binding MarR family transcriptional regulator
LSIVSTDPPGHELALRLLLGFRVLVDAVHADLTSHGHPELRPVHGFVLQAVGPSGATAVELGRRLGVSKQAAAKHIDFLEDRGYLERTTDPRDARRKPVRVTGQGLDFLRRSAVAFDEVRAGWARTLGEQRLRALEADLRAVTPEAAFRLDLPGWFGGG